MPRSLHVPSAPLTTRTGNVNTLQLLRQAQGNASPVEQHQQQQQPVEEHHQQQQPVEHTTSSTSSVLHRQPAKLPDVCEQKTSGIGSSASATTSGVNGQNNPVVPVERWTPISFPSDVCNSERPEHAAVTDSLSELMFANVNGESTLPRVNGNQMATSSQLFDGLRSRQSSSATDSSVAADMRPHSTQSASSGYSRTLLIRRNLQLPSTCLQQRLTNSPI